MSDPVDYMNKLLQWPLDPPNGPPPEWDERWSIKVAAACEIISERDYQIERRNKNISQLLEILSECEIPLPAIYAARIAIVDACEILGRPTPGEMDSAMPWEDQVLYHLNRAAEIMQAQPTPPNHLP